MGRFGNWIVAFLAILGFTTIPAVAQQIKPLDVERDANGVDLLTGLVAPRMPTLSIPAAPELTFTKLSDFWPVLEGRVPTSGPTENVSYSINAGGIASDSFACADGCGARNGRGSEILGGYTQGPFYYIQGGTGKEIIFDIRMGPQNPPAGGDIFHYLASSVNIPGQASLSFQYDASHPFPSLPSYTSYRISRVISSSGYQLIFTYQTNDQNDTGWWGILQKAEIAKNSAPNIPLASLTYGGTHPSDTITDIAGRVYECTNCQNSLIGAQPSTSGSLKLPSETATHFQASVTNHSGSHTLSINNDGVQFVYHVVKQPGSDPDLVDNITVTAPSGFYRYIEVTNTPIGGVGSVPSYRKRIDYIRDSLNQTTHYEYGAFQRVIKITYPEMNSVEVSYDSGGNITMMTQKPKPGSALPDIVQLANYEYQPGCLSVVCFLPTWTRDANGNQTDYVWGTHAGILTQLDPPDANGQRRKVKNSYDNAGRPIREEICATDGAGVELTCGTANSFVKETSYFDGTRLPLTETLTNGVGDTPLTTTYAYDNAGRLLSEDGPLPGSDDAVYYRYDNLGRRTWEISPQWITFDGHPYRQATRTYYRNADDQPHTVQYGHIAGASDTNLVVHRQTGTGYNARRLPLFTILSSGDTRYAATQMSYDALNREECTAIRMNPASFTGLPWSACVLAAEGPDGPDRITRKQYDTEGRLTILQQAYGTPLQQNYATYSYTANGQQESITDARGYRAEMRYDGFDRQTHWYFPSKTATGVIDAGDYEQYGHDPNGNRTSLRRRDGTTLSFQYDSVNRMIRKTVPERPGLLATHTRDVFYSYDIRGLQTGARFDSVGGEGLATAYDQYGRVVSNTQTMDGFTRALGYQYDANGNRLRLTYPDNQAVQYGRDSFGRIYYSRLLGGPHLFGVGYDNRGQLVSWSAQWDQASWQWTHGVRSGYDPVSRLAMHSFLSTSGEFDTAAYFARNPASQITNRWRSNDTAYAWDGHQVADRAYTANGLNQYTQVGASSYCHDANGNLTADGQHVYLYDGENRLVEMRAQAGASCPGWSSGYTGQIRAALRYDPLGRLHEVTDYVDGISQGPRRFLHDGDKLVAEYDGAGTMLARYVHGDGPGDDPKVWFAGSSVADGAKRYLYNDERGSVTLVTDAPGNGLWVNSYDEYGVPGSGNQGRFQYTGQAWLAELGMYYYKARMYSPILGRFMQTDPIGYEDQVNLYAYVGNDPINGIDPFGMAKACTDTPGSRVQSCVTVDADFDGDGNDDLSASQLRQIGDSYRGAILANHGADLSDAGVDITGGGSLSDKAMASVSSQFVGHAISQSGDQNLQAGWERLSSIWLGRNPRDGSPAWTDGVSRMGIDPNSRWFRAGPSNIARMIIHETYHLGFGDRWGGRDFSFFWRQHSRLDDMAKGQLKRGGLAGGGCLPNPPFSGC